MRISDWSSDVCSSDLVEPAGVPGLRRADLGAGRVRAGADPEPDEGSPARTRPDLSVHQSQSRRGPAHLDPGRRDVPRQGGGTGGFLYALPYAAPPLYRSEEHTSELQSLMRISYAVF